MNPLLPPSNEHNSLATIETHNHDGVNSKNLSKTVAKSVSAAPTHVPRNADEQRVLYINGTTYREYIYIDGSWYYYALTKV